jgi:hypothetical protein
LLAKRGRAHAARYGRKRDVVRLDELRRGWFVEHVGRDGRNDRDGHGGHDR